MDINATLIGQAISFMIFVWFTMKFVWPPLMQAIEERQNKIADGLAAGERGQQDLELAKQKASETLKEAKEQAASIIDQANKRASQIVDEAKGDAKVEADRVLAGAQAEIDQSVNRAKEDLRAQVASIALAGAEKILERSIDASAHDDILNKLAAEI